MKMIRLCVLWPNNDRKTQPKMDEAMLFRPFFASYLSLSCNFFIDINICKITIYELFKKKNVTFFVTYQKKLYICNIKQTKKLQL